MRYIISLTYYCNLLWALFIAVLRWYLQQHGSVHPSCHVSWLQEYHKGLSADLVNPKGHYLMASCLFLAVCTKYLVCHQCIPASSSSLP